MTYQEARVVYGRPFHWRDVDEHALRFLAAQRDFPDLNHQGTEPAILTFGYSQERMEALRREFQRRA